MQYKAITDLVTNWHSAMFLKDLFTLERLRSRKDA